MATHHHHHSGLFPARPHTGVFWKDHSLSLILIWLMTAQTLYAIWSGHYVWMHELPFEPSGLESNAAWSTDFWVWWSWEYNVSLVADTFGVLIIVLLSKWFREKGSAESS